MTSPAACRKPMNIQCLLKKNTNKLVHVEIQIQVNYCNIQGLGKGNKRQKSGQFFNGSAQHSDRIRYNTSPESTRRHLQTCIEWMLWLKSVAVCSVGDDDYSSGFGDPSLVAHGSRLPGLPCVCGCTGGGDLRQCSQMVSCHIWHNMAHKYDYC